MSFFAMYDPITDKIYNAKEGTLVYAHEEGHRDYFKRGMRQHISVFEGYAVLGTLASLSIQRFGVAQFCVGFILACELTEELYAWFYAFKKKLFPSSINELGNVNRSTESSKDEESTKCSVSEKVDSKSSQDNKSRDRPTKPSEINLPVIQSASPSAQFSSINKNLSGDTQ